MGARVRALGSVLAAASLCVLAAPAVPAAETPPELAQELSLDGLGLGPQPVMASHGAAEVSFPPPVTELASAGSFVRIFFSHSLEVGAGSTMLIAVNGQPLTTVSLVQGTAAGGVLESRVPAAVLDDHVSNRLQVTFEMRPQPGTAGTLYGRLDGQTMIHYALAAPGGVPGLDAYPFSLLGGTAARSSLGVVLPVTPDAGEAAAALRVLADLGRRAATRRVRPQVVTAGQLTWLAAGGTGALLVGRLDALPAAPPVLEAAGWRRSAAGWTAPGGQEPGRDEGVIASAVSPWDRRSPLVLVTGGTDAAVGLAAAALVGGGPPLAGSFAIVSGVPPATDVSPEPGGTLHVSLTGPGGLALVTAGRYRAAAPFVAPAVDPEDAAILDVTLPAFGGSVLTGAVEAYVNGSRVAAAPLAAGRTGPTQVHATFSGGLLRPGRNALTVDVRADAPPAGGASPAPAGGEAATATGDDTVAARLSLPRLPPADADLELLPFPFLGGSRPTEVVLADAGVGTLSAAAQAMLALGSRAARPPAALRAVFTSSWKGPDDDSLIVVGSPPARGPLADIGRRLPVVFAGSGQVTLRGQGGAGDVRLTSRLGAVQRLTTADGSSRDVLWLAGTGDEMLAGAAAAMYESKLSGGVTVVDAAGRLSVVEAGGGAQASAPGPGVAQVAAVVASLLLLAVLVLQLLRPRRRTA